MEKTSKVGRLASALMMVLGAAAFIEGIGYIPYFGSFVYSLELKEFNKNGWSVMFWYVCMGLAAVGVILIIRGLISLLKDRGSGNAFDVVLAAIGAALFSYRLGYYLYNEIDFIKDDYLKYAGDTEKTEFWMSFFVWVFVYAVFTALGIVLAVLAVKAMKNNSDTAYQSGYEDYQPAYGQNPVYQQPAQIPQQRICAVCGTVVEGKFCPRCGTPWQE